MARDRANVTEPIEVAFPDIERYRDGGTGIDFVTSLTATEPGPHVLMTGLVHGNEPCGAIALDWLLRHDVKPVRGTLSLAFVNVEAYRRFDRAAPMASRFIDEDFNRLWSPDILESERASHELSRARELRPLVDTVDLLLDLHSMPYRVPGMMLCGPSAKGLALAREVCTPPFIVADRGHAAGPRLRDYGAFSADGSPRNALLAECGQHWEADVGAAATEVAIRFLKAVDAVAPDFGEDYLEARPLPPPQRLIAVSEAVTVKTERFRFAADYHGMELIPKAGTVIAHDAGRAVRTPHDDCVLVMPSKRLLVGATAVRFGRYVTA